MTQHENMPRFITKNPLLSFATLLYGLAWFVVSVVAFCLFVVTKRKRPSPLRTTSNTIFILNATPQPASDGAQPPTSMLIPRDVNYHVSFGELPSGMQRRRGGQSTMFAVMPSESGSITITTSTSTPGMSIAASAPPALVNPPAEYTEGPLTSEPEQDPEPEPEADDDFAMQPPPLSRRPTISMKLPKVFRRKSKRVSVSGGSSDESSRAPTPCNLSPTASPGQRLAELLPESGSETIPLERRKSYHKAEDDGEFIRQRFVNPLRFKPKRAHTCSVTSSGSNTPFLPAAHSPSPPPSSFTNHKRNRLSLSSLGSVIRPHTTRARSSSPHGGSFSSTSSTSTSASSATFASGSSASTSASSFSSSAPPTKRSFSHGSSERDVPRTQPYGAPYYAPMPVPRPSYHRASLSHTGVVVKGVRQDVDDEDDERVGTPARLVKAGSIDGEEGDSRAPAVHVREKLSKAGSMHRRQHREAGAVR